MSAIQKRKLLENAQKFLQKGQLDRALKEFQAILQTDPRDGGTRLKLGDVHLRRGEKDEAIAAYLKVADQFMKDGFDAKAVALYKQTLKIDPARADVHVPLAELYQRLGLTSEAMSSLQSAADSLQREGRKRDALELLRKMAMLDPSNTTSRLKIADLLQQAGMRDEALAELDEVAAELERQGDFEARARVHERVLELDHTRADVILSLGKLALEQSRLQDAEAHARRAAEVRPDAAGGLELLAEVLRASGRDDELEPVYRRLADLHRVRGDEAKAREILQRWVASAPLHSDASDTAPPIDEIAIGDDVAVLDTTSPAVVREDDAELAAPQGDAMARTLGGVEVSAPAAPANASASATAVDDADQLVAEASVYLRYQKTDRAIASLEAALACAPGHALASAKLAELLVSRDPARAATLQAAAAALESAFPPAPASDESDAHALDVEVDVELDLDAGVGDALAAADSPPVPDSREITAHGLSSPDLSPFDTTSEIEIELDESDETGLAPASPSHEPYGDTLSSRVDVTLASTSLAVTAAQIVEEIEEAEFYFQQGLNDEAESVYRRVLAAAPNHPQALVRLGELAAARGEDPASSAGNAGQAVVPDPDCELVAFDDAPGMDLGQSLDDVDLSASFSDLSVPEIATHEPTDEPAGAGTSETHDVASSSSPSLDPVPTVLDDSASEPEDAAAEDEPTAACPTTLAAEANLESEPESAAAAPELDLGASARSHSSVEDIASDPLGLSATQPAFDESSEAPEPFAIDESLDDTATEMGAEAASETHAPGFSDDDSDDDVDDDHDARGEPAGDVTSPVTTGESHDEDEAEPFDLARELADAFEDDDATEGVGSPVASSVDDGIAAAFQEFKRGVSRIVDAADHRTHYDLGIAYREMGLLDDAAHEFAVASAAPALQLSSLHLLALCAIDGKRPRDAVAHLTQALSLPGVPADQMCALRVDLARAHLALGELAEVVDQVDRVIASDAKFPGLAELRAAMVAAAAMPTAAANQHDEEPLERFDDLLAETDPRDEADASDARAATTGAETPAPPAPGPDASRTGGRRRRISFV